MPGQPCPPSGGSPPSYQPVYPQRPPSITEGRVSQKLIAASVRVKAYTKNGLASGSGTIFLVIPSGTYFPTHYALALTNRHVVESGQNFTVDMPGGQQNISATCLGVDGK